jgi:hypothetical protein
MQLYEALQAHVKLKYINIKINVHSLIFFIILFTLIQILKCQNAGLFGILSVWYQTEKNADAAETVWYQA